MKNFKSVTKEKNPQRQLQGAVNRATGARFEDIISVSCAYYARSGIASIQKTPEPMRPVKRLEGGKFVAHFEKKAQPDYKGALKGGRAIMFEAKFTSGDKIEQSRVSKEQSKCLDDFAALGALCFVLADFDSYGYYRIPWSVWCNMKGVYGRLYIKPEDIKQYEVKFANGVLHILDNIHEMNEVLSRNVGRQME